MEKGCLVAWVRDIESAAETLSRSTPVPGYRISAPSWASLFACSICCSGVHCAAAAPSLVRRLVRRERRRQSASRAARPISRTSLVLTRLLFFSSSSLNWRDGASPSVCSQPASPARPASQPAKPCKAMGCHAKQASKPYMARLVSHRYPLPPLVSFKLCASSHLFLCPSLSRLCRSSLRCAPLLLHDPRSQQGTRRPVGRHMVAGCSCVTGVP